MAAVQNLYYSRLIVTLLESNVTVKFLWSDIWNVSYIELRILKSSKLLKNAI